ncbi:MAG: hypothetical protein ACRETN_06695 [Nevskiales bacterium]
MQSLKWGIGTLLAALTLAAQAGTPLQLEPQMGFYVTRYFGATAAVPTEFGFQFNYRDTTGYAYPAYGFNSRPALLDLRFNSGGVTALNISGVNALMPTYVLGQDEGAEDGDGFLSNINWGLVGMVALGGGIYYASENYRDDREDDRARAQGGG